MSWALTLQLLAGAVPVLPPPVATRVHRCEDDLEGPDVTVLQLTQLGLSKAAAYLRLQKARLSGDYSGLLAPPGPTSSNKAAPAAITPGKGRKDRAMSKEEQRLAAAKVRREGAKIMSMAIAAGQPKVGLALFEAGASPKIAAELFGMTPGDGDTFGAMLASTMRGSTPKEIGASVMAAAEKAGYGRKDGTR